MQTLREIGALRAAVAGLRADGGRIAFVPTMGALHAGHMALVEEARRLADHVVASIFVNPIQFGANEDLDAYPRREAADSAMLERAGCTILWAPGATTMYPDGFATSVRVSGVSEGLCGAARPGHFDGVATVVAKLLNQVAPDVALFGEKDFQQLAVIRRMAQDLQLGVEVLGVGTVRDEDGLALSSRNAYLSPDERSKAVELPRTLDVTAKRILSGTPVPEALTDAETRLKAAGFSRVDYVALVNAMTLEPLDRAIGPMRLIAAAVIGTTRLIDNIAVDL